jgi:hypothetical protein
LAQRRQPDYLPWTKNELMREMIATCIRNELKFRFVLMDIWFSATDDFEFITGKGRHFIAALKDNRLIAVADDDRKDKRFVRVEDLDIPEQTVVRGWLKDSKDEVLSAYQRLAIDLRRTSSVAGYRVTSAVKSIGYTRSGELPS